MLQIESVELTPNPQALKFLINHQLTNGVSRQFTIAADALDDPLAKGVFEIDGVVSVFYLNQFITIEKGPSADWEGITRSFKQFLTDFDVSNLPEVTEDEMSSNQHSDNEKINQINAFLDEHIRPALAADGGGVEIIGLEGNILKIRYQGACGSCPTATMGTLQSIENMIKMDIDPEIEVIPA